MVAFRGGVLLHQIQRSAHLSQARILLHSILCLLNLQQILLIVHVDGTHEVVSLIELLRVDSCTVVADSSYSESSSDDWS